MRRSAVAFLAASVLVASPPSAAAAARPPTPSISSVTITAAGGSWPLCRQTATIDYQTGHARAWINVMPIVMHAAWGWTENDWGGPVPGTGSVAIAIENDHAPPSGSPEWVWRATLFYRNTTSGPVDTSPMQIFSGSAPRPASSARGRRRYGRGRAQPKGQRRFFSVRSCFCGCARFASCSISR